MKKKNCYFRKYTLFFFLLYSSQILCEEYVIGKLFGQLGNQMFQIAAAVSLALDNQAVATFPDLDSEIRYNIPLNRKHVFRNLNSTAPHKISSLYKEPFFEFAKLPYSPNIQLEGYFQSEKYFKHNKEAIIKLFEPSYEILSFLNEKYAEIIKSPNTVAIHVRTYKDTTPDCHPFVGWDYLYKATELFENDSLFVVFSDDIRLCKVKLGKILKNKKVIFIEGNSHFHDLYLISLCKHQIMSNSSFSWWGAYLNKNPNKKVVCPAINKWFGKSLSHLNPRDIQPEGAIVIN